jgi:hypothetical protein
MRRVLLVRSCEANWKPRGSKLGAAFSDLFVMPVGYKE